MSADRCFYTRARGNSTILLSLYVNDLLIVGCRIEDVVCMKGEHFERLEMNDLGDARICLRLEIERHRTERILRLSQKWHNLETAT